MDGGTVLTLLKGAEFVWWQKCMGTCVSLTPM